jgi:hypothetical protein
MIANIRANGLDREFASSSLTALRRKPDQATRVSPHRRRRGNNHGQTRTINGKAVAVSARTRAGDERRWQPVDGAGLSWYTHTAGRSPRVCSSQLIDETVGESPNSSMYCVRCQLRGRTGGQWWFIAAPREGWVGKRLGEADELGPGKQPPHGVPPLAPWPPQGAHDGLHHPSPEPGPHGLCPSARAATAQPSCSVPFSFLGRGAAPFLSFSMLESLFSSGRAVLARARKSRKTASFGLFGAFFFFFGAARGLVRPSVLAPWVRSQIPLPNSPHNSFRCRGVPCVPSSKSH